jgi:hypothetical protein
VIESTNGGAFNSETGEGSKLQEDYVLERTDLSLYHAAKKVTNVFTLAEK